MDGNHARALLGVPTHATPAQIRRAFRGAAFAAHPDRGGDAGGFRELLTARDLLLAAQPSRHPATDPFAVRVQDPARPSFSALDTPRRPPQRAEAAPSGHDFDRILADLLAA